MMLDPNVDNGETVSIGFSGLDHLPVNRISVTPLLPLSNRSFFRNFTIRPITVEDFGTYICIVTVSGLSTTQNATSSESVSVSVTGLMGRACTLHYLILLHQAFLPLLCRCLHQVKFQLRENLTPSPVT